MTIYMQTYFIILLTFCGLGMFLFIFAHRRNNQVLLARLELNEFAHSNPDDWNDWRDKSHWLDDLPSYDKMSSIFPFPPSPLRSFVTGRYAKDFWLWRSEKVLQELDAAERLVEPSP